MTAIAILVAIAALMGLPKNQPDPMPPGTPRKLRRYYRRTRLELARTRRR